MKIQEIHFAIHTKTGKVEMFGTALLPFTETNGMRFKYAKINLMLEVREKVKIVSHSGEATSSRQPAQLQFYLGDEWRVLTQYEALQAMEKALTK